MLIICSYETDTRDNNASVYSTLGRKVVIKYVNFPFEIRDENPILDNGWNIRSAFFINNFFISTPKKFLSCFRVGKVYYPG